MNEHQIDKPLLLYLRRITPMVVIAFVLWLNISFYQYWRNIRNIENNGIKTTATIIEKNRFSSRSSSGYTMSYRYMIFANNTTQQYIKNEEQVTKNIFYKYNKMGSIDIQYVTQNPNNSKIIEMPNSELHVFSFFVAIVNIGSLILIIAAYFEYKKK